MNKSRYIDTLTSIRGIAAILVVVFHCHIFFGPISTPEFKLINKWYLFVDLFFVLSGFVLFHVYQHQFLSGPSMNNYLTFMRARFARIYPLHLVTLLFTIFLAIIFRSQIPSNQLPQVLNNILDYKSIPQATLLTHAWGSFKEATWNTPSWSISVEWFLYLIFPSIVWMIGKMQGFLKVFTGLVICIAGLFFIMYKVEPSWVIEITKVRGFGEQEMSVRTQNSIDVITGFALLRGLCAFMIGGIFYQVYKKERYRQYLNAPKLYLFIWISLFISWSADILPDAISVLLFGVIILITSCLVGKMKLFLESNILRWLGDISYSIYLVHIPLIFSYLLFKLSKGDPPVPFPESTITTNWMVTLFICLVVIIIASASYYLIEKPARRWIKSKKVQLKF